MLNLASLPATRVQGWLLCLSLWSDKTDLEECGLRAGRTGYRGRCRQVGSKGELWPGAAGSEGLLGVTSLMVCEHYF